jgi:putative transposase
MNDIFKEALRNPPHLFRANVIYMLTASIYQNKQIILSEARKLQWRDAFLKAAVLYHWRVIAWVVLHNHYHAIVESPDHPLNLSKFMGSYHKFTASLWNSADMIPGRKVWWNYWDTCIRSEKDYYNRLRYVFWNPVKHGFDFAGMDEVKDVPEF